MLLSQISKYLIVRNGQHLSGSLERLRLDMEQLWIMIDQELKDYQKYFPLTKKFNINVAQTPNSRYNFELDSRNPGFDLTADPQVYGTPPEWLSQVVPVGANQQIANYQSWQTSGSYPGQIGRIALPYSAMWEYRKPVLYTNFGGRFDVDAHYNYYVSKTYSTPGGSGALPVLQDVEIFDFQIEEAKIFMDLVSGRFLTMIGRSRRAFTHNQLPITTDAPELVREGEELYAQAQKLMYDRNAWHTSIRL